MKTAKRMITQIIPHDRPGTLVSINASRGPSAIAELLVSPNGRYFVSFLDPVHFFSDFSRDIAMATNFVFYRTFSLGAEVSHDPLDRFLQSLHHMIDIEL